jgi:hypothetical protein
VSLPSATLASQLRDALLAARNADGGWGYFVDKRSRLEPTAAASLGLGRPGELTRVVDAWPKRGALVMEPAIETANYAANAQAALVAMSGERAHADWALRMLGDISTVEGRKTATGDPAISRQDNALRGWPWVDGTFSWAEPTAWCVLALKRGRHRAPSPPAPGRVDEGERLLIDRVCDPGGWNYGNSNVFRRNLPPYVPTTAVALLALQGRAGPAVSRSIAFLQQHRLEERSGLALALTAICLGVYRQRNADVLEALGDQWAGTRFLGNLYATALALYAITGAASGFEALRV